MVGTAPGTGCQYQQLANGIHEFVFYDRSREAVDYFFRTLEQILASTPSDQTARYILDVSQGGGEVSLLAMVQRFRRLETQMPGRARGRTAVLNQSGAVLNFIDGLIRTLAPRRDVTRFFRSDQRDEAITWLLSE